jgi:hypothetical protein
MGWAFLHRFGVSKYVTKNENNKIHRGIRWPPDDEEHTTINQKTWARWRRDEAG